MRLRLLLDECVDYRLLGSMRSHDFVVENCLDWQASASDSMVASYAAATQQILITHDREFTRHAFISGWSQCGVFRLQPGLPDEMLAICIRALTRFGKELLAGSLLIQKGQKFRLIISRQRPG